jgi:branched-chain amino acid transport system substrate-binding protein
MQRALPRRKGRTRLTVRSAAATTMAVATGLTMVAVGTTAAGAAAKAKLKNPPYYIGAEISLSGAYSTFEIPMLQGFEVAVEDINASGGVLGHKVALDYQSDASQTTKVTPALQSIFTGTKAKRIIFMYPNVISAVTDTVLQYTEKYGIASFDPGSGTTIFTATKHPYNYSIYPSDTLQVPAYLTAFEKEAGSASAMKVGILNDTEQGDVSLATEIGKGVKAAGGDLVGQVQVAPTATDVSVQMGQLKADGAKELMVQTSGGPAIAAAEALQTLGWKTVQMIVSPADVNAKVQSSIPATVRSQVHTLGEQIYLQGPTGGPLPKYQKFAKQLAATTGGIDDLEISANLCDAAVLDAWAVNKAKSTTIKKVSAVLNNIGKYTLPKTLLIWMPDPKWTATNHTVSNSTFLKTYWALISPGTEKTGTLPGTKLTMTATVVKIAKSITTTGV